jgi:hypothetical protein
MKTEQDKSLEEHVTWMRDWHEDCRKARIGRDRIFITKMALVGIVWVLFMAGVKALEIYLTSSP